MSVYLCVGTVCVCVCRYRAVTSWSRVQAVGVPRSTVVEICCIWLLSMLLAVPEALGFTVVTFSYRNTSMHTCMLYPQSPFMTVSAGGGDMGPVWVFPACNLSDTDLE